MKFLIAAALYALACFLCFLLPAERAKRAYNEGHRFKNMGWPEQSREAMSRAVALDPDGVGVLAKRFMRTRLPASKVPPEAIEHNIAGHNLMMACDLDGAAAAFETLMKDYPAFEWPYGNRAMVHIVRKEYAQADELLGRALSINDCYVNAWLHLATSKGRAGDAAGREAALAAAYACDPDDMRISGMKEHPSEPPDSVSAISGCAR